jgi:hypothetical protein
MEQVSRREAGHQEGRICRSKGSVCRLYPNRLPAVKNSMDLTGVFEGFRGISMGGGTVDVRHKLGIQSDV